ncbi:hypothetical protein B0A49_04206 [Cryomyces minteri]|uniref:DUF2293 domain-containing protein n=1 Tax=Cryomyces minteri TaxID=331657 RepID=A0A4U0XA10_9PEZI|nr:hypothetical protein B0A49_04206 [Cryomyces minteri]
MTRYHQRAASARVRTAANTGTQKRKNKQYKVVLESVTQEKRKLHSINVSDARVPPGYTYIPVGHPEFSECCKELSRVKGLPVYVVSLRDVYVEPTHASHKRFDVRADPPAGYSQKTGHHFSNAVVEAASVRLGFGPEETTDRRNYGHSGSSHLAKSLANHSRRLGLNYDHVTTSERSQQIRDTLKELFPKIPEADMEKIIGRAFEEGTGRVGTAKELTLAHRVQAATAAHIRHQYTDYDYLLRIGSYHNARAAVSKACIDQVAKWRGEDEDDTAATELEDIFREIIVIDDEDEGEHGSVTSDVRSDSDSSIEIVSRRTAAQDLQQGDSEDAERWDRVLFGVMYVLKIIAAGGKMRSLGFVRIIRGNDATLQTLQSSLVKDDMQRTSRTAAMAPQSFVADGIRYDRMYPTTRFDSASKGLVASRPTRERPYLPTPVSRPVEVQMRPLASPAYGRPPGIPPMDRDRPLPSIESGLSRPTQMARPVLGQKATFTHESQQMHEGLPPSPKCIKATEYLPHDSRRRYAGLGKRLYRDTERSLTNARTINLTTSPRPPIGQVAGRPETVPFHDGLTSASEYGLEDGITARSNEVIQSRAPKDASFPYKIGARTKLCVILFPKGEPYLGHNQYMGDLRPFAKDCQDLREWTTMSTIAILFSTHSGLKIKLKYHLSPANDGVCVERICELLPRNLLGLDWDYRTHLLSYFLQAGPIEYASNTSKGLFLCATRTTLATRGDDIDRQLDHR